MDLKQNLWVLHVLLFCLKSSLNQREWILPFQTSMTEANWWIFLWNRSFEVYPGEFHSQPYQIPFEERLICHRQVCCFPVPLEYFLLDIKLWVVKHLFLKPNWFLYRMFSASKKLIIRLWTSFSKILSMLDKSDIAGDILENKGSVRWGPKGHYAEGVIFRGD